MSYKSKSNRLPDYEIDNSIETDQ